MTVEEETVVVSQAGGAEVALVEEGLFSFGTECARQWCVGEDVVVAKGIRFEPGLDAIEVAQ